MIWYVNFSKLIIDLEDASTTEEEEDEEEQGQYSPRYRIFFSVTLILLWCVALIECQTEGLCIFLHPLMRNANMAVMGK